MLILSSSGEKELEMVAENTAHNGVRHGVGHGIGHGVNGGYDGDEENEGMQYLHCHNYSDRQNEEEIKERREKARKKLITASCICALFMTAEIIGGVTSHSIGTYILS